MEAIILAGGLGTRLRSVVSEVPKCMAPVAGHPFLYYLLMQAEEQGVTKVVLSVGYLREKIYEWIDSHRDEFHFSIEYAVEEVPLGTGGGIRLALELCSEERVAVLNGDTYFDVDLHSMESVKGGSVTLALKPMERFDRYGEVTLQDGLITEFKEKCFCEKGLINGGVYLIDRVKVLQYMHSLPEKFSFETEVLQPLSKRAELAAFVSYGYFIDIGIPEDYTRADREFAIAGGAADAAVAKASPITDTLFLDRDGVINRLRHNDYVKCWEEFEFLPGVLRKLAEWSRHFKRVIVVTNQRGVERGLFTEEALQDVLNSMKRSIEAAGGRIDAIYYCTALTCENWNRKPNPGMAEQAVKDFPDIDLHRSVMIGDSDSDGEFAKNAGIHTFILC